MKARRVSVGIDGNGQAGCETVNPSSLRYTVLGVNPKTQNSAQQIVHPSMFPDKLVR